jgi:hypothetical protein
MGTIHNRVANVFRTIAAAAALLKDLQLVLSIGTETPIPVANVINGLPPCRLTDNSR